jgi:hypothetical protein
MYLYSAYRGTRRLRCRHRGGLPRSAGVVAGRGAARRRDIASAEEATRAARFGHARILVDGRRRASVLNRKRMERATVNAVVTPSGPRVCVDVREDGR